MNEVRARPTFTIVTAVYNVEPYLPEFIESLDRQSRPAGDVEVIAVDDGSTDGSLGVLLEWARQARFTVKVFTRPNGGQGAARNLGLRHATGTWVTFADPDDSLDPDYLRQVARFADAHADVELMSANPIIHLEREDRFHDGHPRRWQYARGNRVADMTAEPNVFPGSTNVGFYRLDRIRRLGLQFEPEVRPNFEDGQFAVRYLLSLDVPRVGLVREARYLYRKRAAQTSSLDLALRDPRRYTTVLEHGYLAVIEQTRAARGHLPEWLQHVVIYELYWYLAEEEKVTSGAYLAPEDAQRFHDLLGRILRELDPEVVARHRVLRLGPVLADVFAHGTREAPWHAPYVVHTRMDREMGLRRYAYRFTGPLPEERFTMDDTPVEPIFGKVMAHRFYGRDLIWTRIIWLPMGGHLSVALDGEHVVARRRWSQRDATTDSARSFGRTRRRIARLLGRSIAHSLRRLALKVRGAALRRRGSALRRLAASSYGRRFRGAWLLMDRIHDADDNGERLYEYLRGERPDINAWFVLERGTPDWRRLAATGERRLLAHGSLAWMVAMLECDWVLSSHVDLPIYRPPRLGATGPATWKFAFLQHGIIKDDLSAWLNLRELELFVVSTEAERASVADDGTTYRFTAKETRNTGLPRFDRLLAKGRAVPAAERNLVIVAPTWRQWLTRPVTSARSSQRRTVRDAFWDSEYIRNWLGILRSEPIAAAVARRGWRLGFMPHPNLQTVLGDLDLPAFVEPLTFAGTDVQGVYAQCALLVTDYSSVVFNTAYLDRPAVYFQFDRDDMLGGAHVGRRGYFDYERDGFGPVAVELEAAERAVVAAIRHGARPTAEYQARIDATFPVRDGAACARVVAAVEELSRRSPCLPDVVADAPPQRRA